MVSDDPANVEQIGRWLDAWVPRADAAIAAYCGALPDSPDATALATQATRDVRRALGV